MAVTEEVVQVPEPPAPDVEEAHVEVDGRTWTVRVLGRSGRVSRGEAPLLLLGFWDDEPGEAPPPLEVTVVGRTLGALTPACLGDALAKASPPPSPGRRKPFFETTHQGKRR